MTLRASQSTYWFFPTSLFGRLEARLTDRAGIRGHEWMTIVTSDWSSVRGGLCSCRLVAESLLMVKHPSVMFSNSSPTLATELQ